jgi:hypothetical protein
LSQRLLEKPVLDGQEGQLARKASLFGFGSVGVAGRES